ncbi:MBL fold metallo-hydrolase [Mycolicibacterium goodii]
MVRRASQILVDPLVDGDTADLVLAIHTYVVELGDHIVLIDAGNGNGKQRPNLLPHHMLETDYLRRLAAAGFTPDDIDIVIPTHLHPDHCGGATTEVEGVWVPTFAKATHLFSAADLTWLQSLSAAEGLDGIAADLAQTFADSVRPIVDTASWCTVTDGDVVAAHGDSSLVVRSLPGHTGGHLALELRTGHGGALFTGDAVHHPIQLIYPQLSQAGDADPELAQQSRQAFLQRCAAEQFYLLTAHFAVDAAVRVEHDQDGRPVVRDVLRDGATDV